MDKRKQNLLIIGGILLFFAAIYRFYPAVAGFLPSDDQFEMKQEQLLQLEKQLEKMNGMQSSLDEMKQHLDKVESRLFIGDTPSLAAVEIQKILSNISKANGAQIDSIEVLSVNPLEDHPYVEIPVRFILLSEIHQLKNILYGIESHDRLMAVKEATVKSRGARGEEGRVYVVLTVTGLMKAKKQ